MDDIEEELGRGFGMEEFIEEAIDEASKKDPNFKGNIDIC